VSQSSTSSTPYSIKASSRFTPRLIFATTHETARPIEVEVSPTARRASGAPLLGSAAPRCTTTSLSLRSTECAPTRRAIDVSCGSRVGLGSVRTGQKGSSTAPIVARGLRLSGSFVGDSASAQQKRKVELHVLSSACGGGGVTRVSTLVRTWVRRGSEKVTSPQVLAARSGSEDCPVRESSLPRKSDEWRRLYRGRSAVEREFGRLKHHYALAMLRVRGIERVRLHADLTMIARLAPALSRARTVALAA
jgi:hypothetical protein